MKEENTNTQRLARMRHQAQQPCLAAEANVKPDTKTRTHMEGVATDYVKYGDILPAWDEEDPTSLTSFGNIAKPLAPEKSNNAALVNEGAEARLSHPWRCAC